MKAYNGFEAKKSGGAREILPAGGYVAKVLDSREVEYSWGKVILVSFDIAEGQYKDHFRTDFANNTNEDKKWRGTYRLNEPKDDGTEKDSWTKNGFNNAVWAFEASNPGYHWNWDEASFKGKLVGVLFRDKEWEMNGNTGWTTECCALTSVSDIREGKFKMPKAKPLAQKPAAPTFTAADWDDEDAPF